MSGVVAELVILILLLVVNGVFAMTEIAIVSTRKVRLRRLAEQGDFIELRWPSTWRSRPIVFSPKPLIVPASQTAIQLLDTFKQSGKHIALVTDEFGAIVGLVALHDVMEALVGELPSFEERSRPQIKRREDGSWLIDAMIEIKQVENELPGFRPGSGGPRDYQTLAGFIVKELGHVPREGETVLSGGYVFEVLDMDRHRIDKVLVIRPPNEPPANARN